MLLASDGVMWTLSEAGAGKGHRPWAVAFLLIGDRLERRGLGSPRSLKDGWPIGESRRCACRQRC